MLKAEFDGNVLVAYALDFVQYDEGLPQAWNRGSIRFNSDIPVPEPATAVLLAASVPLLALRRPRRRR